MILLMVTVLALRQHLPMSLATKKMAKRYAKARQQTGNTDDSDGEMDLFSRHRKQKKKKEREKVIMCTNSLYHRHSECP